MKFQIFALLSIFVCYMFNPYRLYSWYFEYIIIMLFHAIILYFISFYILISKLWSLSMSNLEKISRSKWTGEFWFCSLSPIVIYFRKTLYSSFFKYFYLTSAAFLPLQLPIGVDNPFHIEKLENNFSDSKANCYLPSFWVTIYLNTQNMNTIRLKSSIEEKF